MLTTCFRLLTRTQTAKNQALAVDLGERYDSSHDGGDAAAAAALSDSTFYEITIATVDQPKLLSRLSDAMVGRRSRVEPF